VIIDDPKPSTETTDCGCETGEEDRSLIMNYGFGSNAPYSTISNSKLNTGAFFVMEEDEKCTLNVQFDYLFKFDCDDLISSLGGSINYTPPCDLAALWHTYFIGRSTRGVSFAASRLAAYRACVSTINADLAALGSTIVVAEEVYVFAQQGTPNTDALTNVCDGHAELVVIGIGVVPEV